MTHRLTLNYHHLALTTIFIPNEQVDIEGDEWSVFKELVKEPILDIIGQVRVHECSTLQ